MDSLWLPCGVALLWRFCAATRARFALLGVPGLWRCCLRRTVSVRCVGSSRRRGRGIYLAAVLELVLPVDNRNVTHIQAGAQSDGVGCGLCDRHGSYFNGVVSPNDVHVGALWPALDCGRWHDDQILLYVGKQVNVDKLIRE